MDNRMLHVIYNLMDNRMFHVIYNLIEKTKLNTCSSYFMRFMKKIDKEHILISRRYQLHPASATTNCPNSITDEIGRASCRERVYVLV